MSVTVYRSTIPFVRQTEFNFVYENLVYALQILILSHARQCGGLLILSYSRLPCQFSLIAEV